MKVTVQYYQGYDSALIKAELDGETRELFLQEERQIEFLESIGFDGPISDVDEIDSCYWEIMV